jgi:hypothetical protein
MVGNIRVVFVSEEKVTAVRPLNTTVVFVFKVACGSVSLKLVSLHDNRQSVNKMRNLSKCFTESLQ